MYTRHFRHQHLSEQSPLRLKKNEAKKTRSDQGREARERASANKQTYAEQKNAVNRPANIYIQSHFLVVVCVCMCECGLVKGNAK